MQSYNNSQTGIWPQEESYEQCRPYTSMTDIDNDIGIPSRITQPFLHVADADAAAPFDTQSYSFRDASLLHRGFDDEGALEPAAPSFTSPSTSHYSVPRNFHPLTHGRLGVSIVNYSTMNLGVPSAQQLIEVEQPIYPLGSNQSSFSHHSANITSYDPRLGTANIDFMNTPAPASSPSILAVTSSSIVESCPYSGCRAKFTGSSWKDSLRRHKNNEHENREKPICPVCHTAFGSGRRDNMKRHVISRHPEYHLPTSRVVRSRRSALRRRRP